MNLLGEMAEYLWELFRKGMNFTRRIKKKGGSRDNLCLHKIIYFHIRPEIYKRDG